ncbi:MAG: DUF342 domain-containing protein [SAR324 cluster bacterium]|nr:DUF342 domain-containing protein [SAR324 cluster bacterium]
MEEQEVEALFELKVQSGKIYLRISPPQYNLKADLDEIQEQLHDMEADYLPETLLEIYEEASNNFELLCDEEVTDFQFNIELTNGFAGAYLTVIPPISEPTTPLSTALMEEELRNKGVIQGIMKDVLQKIIDEQIEHEPVLVARGRKPVNGKDGYIQLVYGADNQKKKEEALRVNHREMNVISTAKVGDVLVNIIPPTAGRNGFNVKGMPISAKPGKKVTLLPGRHTAFNGDRTQIRATKAGYVVLMDYKISIENIYKVQNIDGSVGNLNFDGIVYVDGNIEDGYTVHATVRIEVRGSVGKANLFTEGEIIVEKGIMGATVKADGSVRTAFISDSKIDAGRNVIVKEYILNSDVSAGKVIHVTNPEGSFHGGNCHSGNFINIPNVGSNKLGDETMVEVGMDPETRLHFKRLESTIQDNLYKFEKTKKNLMLLQAAREKRGVLQSEHEKMFNQLAQEVQQLRDDSIKDIKEWRNTMDIVKVEHDKSGGIIFIAGNIYPGAIVKIRRMLYHVQMPVARAAFLSVKGRIQMQDYDDVIRFYRRHFLKK